MNVAISLFKSKLAYYLRLVKSGEEVQILERDVPVACVTPIRGITEELVIPAGRSIENLRSMVFTTKLSKDECDVAEFLIDERKKR